MATGRSKGHPPKDANFMALVKKKVPKAYSSLLQISQTKFKDLQDLLDAGLIPLVYKDFYDNLPNGAILPIAEETDLD